MPFQHLSGLADVALIDTEHAGRQSLRVGVGELQVIAAASAGHPQEVFVARAYLRRGATKTRGVTTPPVETPVAASIIPSDVCPRQ